MTKKTYRLKGKSAVVDPKARFQNQPLCKGLARFNEKEEFFFLFGFPNNQSTSQQGELGCIRPGVSGECQGNLHRCLQAIFRNGHGCFQYQKSVVSKGEGVYHRVIESHLFSGCLLLGRTPFKYLCKYVSELKCDLTPRKLSSLVHYFFGRGREPASKGKG